MAEVALSDVNKRYGPVEAVIHFDLVIKDEEFVVLVGPSGCGKSTTLRMVAGLEDISSGAIRIGERIVNRLPPKDRDIAMVFQNYALYQHMTIYDNLAFGLRNRKVSETRIREEVERAAAVLGITELLGRKPRQLSGGQQQLVGVARAIISNPKLILADEPTGNLHSSQGEEIMELFRKLNEEGVTIVQVTHSEKNASYGKRVVQLRDGWIVKENQ